MKRPRHILYWSALVGALSLAAAAIGLWIFAPQVLVLAREGFPADVYPTHGRFALLRGVPGSGAFAADMPGPHSMLNEAAKARFERSGGRALLIDRKGTLVTEAYGQDGERETRLNSYSLVKSLVGALVVKAVADGKINGFHTPLDTLLGENAPNITVGEALTMTSGLVMPAEPPKSHDVPLDDAGFSLFGPLAKLHAFGVEELMPDLHVDPEIRGEYRYQSANTALLGLVLEKAYQTPLPDLVSEQLWRPAGAGDAYWRMTPAGEHVSAYCCLYARPIDWLRVGRFLLNNGTREEPFLPHETWREWVMPQLGQSVRRAGAYGQHLRHDVLDRPKEAMQGPFAYFSGHGGQMVYLLPDQGIVVVRFGERPQLLHSTLYELFPDG